MKLQATTALILSLLQASASVSASVSASSFNAVEPISTTSKAGLTLLSKSRLLEGEDGDGDENGGDENGGEEEENNDNNFTWMQNYSIKFLGCHHVAHWNSDANEDGDGNGDGDGDANDVKIKVERHVRYRLCPSSSCNHNTVLGCKDGYGDYIVDMSTFLNSYIENKEQIQEEQCEARLNACGCGNGNGNGNGQANKYYDDAFNQQDDGDDDQEMCEYKCFKSVGMTQCIDKNPYYDDEQQEEEDDFDLQDYTYCEKIEGGGQGEEGEEGGEDGEDGGEEGEGEEGGEEGEGEGEGEEGGEGEGEGGDRRRRRQLNRKRRNRRKLDQEQEVEYYLGAYCADNGSEIHLGMFTDNTCTSFADSNGGSKTYYETFGSSIPYHGSSLVDTSCYTCKDTNYYDGDEETREICTENYQVSGKCETKLSPSTSSYNKNNNYNYNFYPNENACTYIDGIKLLKHSSNGVIYRPYHGTKKAAIAIAFFATTFILLAFYTCYLRNKVYLARKAAALAASNRSPRSPRDKGFFKKVVKALSPRSIKKKLSFNRSNSRGRGSDDRKAEALM